MDVHKQWSYHTRHLHRNCDCCVIECQPSLISPIGLWRTGGGLKRGQDIFIFSGGIRDQIWTRGQSWRWRKWCNSGNQRDLRPVFKDWYWMDQFKIHELIFSDGSLHSFWTKNFVKLAVKINNVCVAFMHVEKSHHHSRSQDLLEKGWELTGGCLTWKHSCKFQCVCVSVFVWMQMKKEESHSALAMWVRLLRPVGSLALLRKAKRTEIRVILRSCSKKETVKSSTNYHEKRNQETCIHLNLLRRNNPEKWCVSVNIHPVKNNTTLLYYY